MIDDSNKDKNVNKPKRSTFKKDEGFIKKKKFTSDEENAKPKERKKKKGAGKRPSGKKEVKEFDPLEPMRLNKYIA